MVRLVGLEVLKRRLRSREDEVVTYAEFLDACVDAGAAPTRGQAEALAGAMDQSGSVVLFRGKVYLHPEKVTFTAFANILVLRFSALCKHQLGFSNFSLDFSCFLF